MDRWFYGLGVGEGLREMRQAVEGSMILILDVTYRALALLIPLFNFSSVDNVLVL